jgi:hypothetical protein
MQFFICATVLARGIAIEAPRRHAAAFADPAVGIDAGGKAQFAGALAVWIRPIHRVLWEPFGIAATSEQQRQQGMERK